MRNLFDKYGEKVLNTATKTRLEVLKTASKKEVHKTADATGEFMGMKTADKIVKPKLVPNDNWRNVEETVIPSDKKQEILTTLIQVI